MPTPLAELAARVEAGEQAAAGRALSLVINESAGYEELARAFFRHAGRSHKVGVSGPPGAGKSTLLGRLLALYRAAGERVGVLAVDPTSPFTGGAFLGDRLRVQEHALDPGVFIRSLGSRGMVGGIAATLFGAVHVLEAYGCDRILIETVGTGQDEVEIAHAADSVLYVTTPALGDEIQAMKAGAMEVADLFVVNKCDLAGADKAAASLNSALGLAPRRAGSWPVRVLSVSAAAGRGVEELARALDEHRRHLGSSSEGEARRRRQLREELALFVSRRLARDVLGRIREEHVDRLMEKSSDPVTLGESLISMKRKGRPGARRTRGKAATL